MCVAAKHEGLAAVSQKGKACVCVYVKKARLGGGGGERFVEGKEGERGWGICGRGGVQI